MGSAARRSAARNTTPHTTEAASRPRTSGLDNPYVGRNVNAKRNAPTQAAIENAPAQSRSSSSHRTCRRPAARGGNTAMASTAEINNSGTWRKNIHRQPKAWITGPPRATPITGPPAPTSDQKPSAFTRSPWSNTDSTSAIEAAPIDAPTMPPRMRAVMSTPMFGASADRAAATVSAMIPAMNSRRCPNKSPALPTSGATTP